MASFNKIILMGNLTRDPQLKILPSQTAVCEFGIACNEKWKAKDGEQREEVLFVDCVIFGKGAEVINQYMQKGKAILVEGKLALETWEDKQGGGKRSKHKVKVESFTFVGGPQQGGDGGDRQQRPTNKRPADSPFEGDTEQQFKDEDIPF